MVVYGRMENPKSCFIRHMRYTYEDVTDGVAY